MRTARSPECLILLKEKFLDGELSFSMDNSIPHNPFLTLLTAVKKNIYYPRVEILCA